MYDRVVAKLFKMFDENNKVKLNAQEEEALTVKDNVYLQWVHTCR